MLLCIIIYRPWVTSDDARSHSQARMGRGAPDPDATSMTPDLVYAQAQEADAEDIQRVAGESWRVT